jgi:hypothetical protein
MDITLILLLFSQILSLYILSWGVVIYITVSRRLSIVHNIVKRNIKMNIEDVLFDDERADPSAAVPSPAVAGLSLAPTDIGKKRARLAAQISGGFRLSFKGKNVTPELVDAMSDAEVEELNARMEARLGAAMSKSLGSTIIRLYTGAAASLLSISPEEMPRLAKELEEDPLIHNFLQNIGCELYHRFGMYLAPLAAAAITTKHCDWNSDAGRSSTMTIINGATELDCGPQVNTDDQ